tara:strand:- start:195 stop:770 length:576 start_codon:yes stop_codon:yes gene_type:complete
LKLFYTFITYIFNPLLVAPYSFGLIIYNDLTIISKHLIFIVCILFSNIFPLITIIYFIRIDRLSSLDAPIREQRVGILAIAAIYYALGFLILLYFNVSPIIKGLMFCYAFNTALVWKITMHWKISIHMIGLGGPFIALWFSGFQYPFIMGIIIILVSISRFMLKAHTASQIISGTILAMSLAYIQLTFLFL